MSSDLTKTTRKDEKGLDTDCIESLSFRLLKQPKALTSAADEVGLRHNDAIGRLAAQPKLGYSDSGGFG